MHKIILLVLVINLFCNPLASAKNKSIIVYKCSTDAGAIGYYDKPCRFINGIDYDIQAILQLNSVTKTLPNRQKTADPSVIINSKDTKALNVRRCQNAKEKLPLLLYQLRHEKDQEALAKLKRSIKRYTKIQKISCGYNK